MNNLNIVEALLFFSSVLAGNFPAHEARYMIDREPFDWLYFLADGIHTRF